MRPTGYYFVQKVRSGPTEPAHYDAATQTFTLFSDPRKEDFLDKELHLVSAYRLHIGPANEHIGYPHSEILLKSTSNARG